MNNRILVYLTNDLINRADWLNDFCILTGIEQFLISRPIIFSLAFKCCGTLRFDLVEFLKKILSQQKRQNMVKNYLKIWVFLSFWKLLPLIFAGNGLKWELIFLSSVSTNPISEEILSLELNWKYFQLTRLQDFSVTFISPEGMTRSSWLSAWKQIPEQEKISTKFFKGCSAQRHLKSGSVMESSIEQKLREKRDFKCIFNSQFIIASPLVQPVAVFMDQLEIYKDHCFPFLLSLLGDPQVRKMSKKNGISGLTNGCKLKILVMLSSSVKTSYLEIC